MDRDCTTLYDPIGSSDQVVFAEESHPSDLPVGARLVS